MQADSLPSEPPGKPKNTEVGSPSLLQGIFPTQQSNWGLLHCRWILYQLSHKGKPKNTGVGSLSLFQRIFPTQQSNWGLLPCRWILYQLSYWTKIDLIYVLALSLLSCVTLSKLLHLSEPPSLFREMGVSKRTYLGEKMLRSCLPGTWSRVRHVGCRQRMPGLALVY